jgi:hypothetical protein
MFNDARSFGEPKVSMETFREWANSVAHQYLSGQATPSEGVTKIAQIEELTPAQIELLATETNKLIHTQKHASASTNKYFAADFPHADAKTIIASLQATDHVKVAAVAPDPTFEGGPDEFSMFGVEAPVMDKTAAVKRELRGAEEKIAAVLENATDRVTIAKYAAESSEMAFLKTARQLVLGADSPTERLQTIGMIDHMLKTAKMTFAKTALAKLAYTLGREGLLNPKQTEDTMNYLMAKEADMKAPEGLISGWLPARVINGNHPLYITLKTFRDSTQSLRECTDRHSIIADKLDLTRQRIRAL